MNGGTAINNLDVYPNPTRDIFNVSFVSEEIQTLSIRVMNIVGEVIYEESLEEFVVDNVNNKIYWHEIIQIHMLLR